MFDVRSTQNGGIPLSSDISTDQVDRVCPMLHTNMRQVRQYRIDQIDRILSDFRRFVEAFNTRAIPEWSVVLKGVQVAGSLQQVLSAEHVRQLLDPSLVDRAQRPERL